jgi:hypothetical protein
MPRSAPIALGNDHAPVPPPKWTHPIGHVEHEIIRSMNSGRLASIELMLDVVHDVLRSPFRLGDTTCCAGLPETLKIGRNLCDP